VLLFDKILQDESWIREQRKENLVEDDKTYEKIYNLFFHKKYEKAKNLPRLPSL